MPESRVTRIALTGASGNGKTTLALSLAGSLALPFIDLEGADRAQAAELVATDAWVTDATHERVLGDLVLSHAQLLVWHSVSASQESAEISDAAVEREGDVPGRVLESLASALD